MASVSVGGIKKHLKKASSMSAPVAPLRGPARLREQLKDPIKIIVAPGVYGGISARVALATGFHAPYMASIPSKVRATIYLPNQPTSSPPSLANHTS